MISRILVATDGSETSWKAVKYAADLAFQTRATVAVLSVVDNTLVVPQSIPSQATPTHLIEPLEDYLRQVAEAAIEVAERTFQEKGITLKKVIRTGHPIEEIITEAEKSAADLIVMGSHGKSALRAALLGSVTFGVIHKDTKIPVLVVRR